MPCFILSTLFCFSNISLFLLDFFFFKYLCPCMHPRCNFHPKIVQTPEEPLWKCKIYWVLATFKVTKNFPCETSFHPSSPLNLPRRVSYKANMLGILSKEKHLILVLYFKIHSIDINTLGKTIEILFQKCFDIDWNDFFDFSFTTTFYWSYYGLVESFHFGKTVFLWENILLERFQVVIIALYMPLFSFAPQAAYLDSQLWSRSCLLL